jgi:hypothetical protein
MPEGESPAAAIARHRDADGRPLDESVAAIELLNLLRPMVATARFVAFAALALHRYPETRDPVRAGDAEHATAFVHEVRRFYPFFPAIGGAGSPHPAEPPTATAGERLRPQADGCSSTLMAPSCFFWNIS